LLVAEALLAQELQRAPHDARLLLFYAATLEGVGRTEAAEEWYQRALAASPRKQVFLTAYASFLMNQGRFKEAESLLRQAYDLAPENDEAARNLASVLILQGKEREVRSFLLEHAQGDTQRADALLVQALEVLGRWEEAAHLRESHLSSSSSLEEVLAVVRLWLLAGKRDKAEAAMRQWEQWQPQHASTAGMLLQQVRSLSPSEQQTSSAP
jgi:Flp pilus assembly protein TadD